MKLKIVLVTVLLLATAFPALATATRCDDLTDHYRFKLRSLYYYALLVEATDTGKLPRWACEASRRGHLGPPSIYKPNTSNRSWNHHAEKELPPCRDGVRPCLRRLTTGQLDEGMYHWSEIVAAFRHNNMHIGVYEPAGGGPAYVVCDSRRSDIMLFLGLSEFQVPVDDGDLRPRILRPIVWLVENSMIDEALETVTLRKNNDLSDETFPEQVTAIRGTRPDRLPQWRASVHQLLHGSCVFRFMAHLSRHFMEYGGSNYAVTGHSLGGAVAQYVAQLHTANTRSSYFRAFAFNAIGTNARVNPEFLESFYIREDPVSALGTGLGQLQAGRSVRYTPPDTPNWRIIAPQDRLNRHSLNSVQQAICDCMTGLGSLEVIPEYVAVR